MIKDGKCAFCGKEPERKINAQPLSWIDGGTVRAVEPRQMIDYAYYVCKCGMRYTPQEVEGG